MNTVIDLLNDLLAELSDVEQFTSDGLEAFGTNRMAQKAVIRSYEVIGEIVKRIPTDVRDFETRINWKELAAFRDFLIHRYDKVSIDRLRNAIVDLPNLKAAVEALRVRLISLDDNSINRTQPPT